MFHFFSLDWTSFWWLTHINKISFENAANCWSASLFSSHKLPQRDQKIEAKSLKIPLIITKKRIQHSEVSWGKILCIFTWCMVLVSEIDITSHKNARSTTNLPKVFDIFWVNVHWKCMLFRLRTHYIRLKLEPRWELGVKRVVFSVHKQIVQNNRIRISCWHSNLGTLGFNHG